MPVSDALSEASARAIYGQARIIAGACAEQLERIVTYLPAFPPSEWPPLERELADIDALLAAGIEAIRKRLDDLRAPRPPRKGAR